MSRPDLLIIGATVRCTDGPCGHLRRLIADPVEQKLTFLAVRPPGLRPGRMVRADQVASGGGEVLLRCSKEEFEEFELDEARPGAGADPAGGLPGAPAGPAAGFEQLTGYGNRGPAARELIPAGGVDVRRGEPVYAGEREVGRAEGLGVDLDQQLITHLVLAVGRFRGRKRVAVPIEHVASFGDGIQLGITKSQVGALPRLPKE